MIYTSLRNDHVELKKLLKDMVDTTERAVQTRQTLRQTFADLLMAHSKAEEDVFYQPLRDQKETHDIILEAQEEHHLAETVLKEILDLDVSDETWVAKVEVLQESLKHHIEEEEEEIFPKAQKILSSDEAKRMGEAFEEAMSQMRKK